MNPTELMAWFKKYDNKRTYLLNYAKREIKDEKKANKEYSLMADLAQEMGMNKVTEMTRSIAADEFRHGNEVLPSIVSTLEGYRKMVMVNSSGGTSLTPGSIVSWSEFHREAWQAHDRREALPDGTPILSPVY